MHYEKSSLAALLKPVIRRAVADRWSIIGGVTVAWILIGYIS